MRIQAFLKSLLVFTEDSWNQKAVLPTQAEPHVTFPKRT